MTAKVYVDVLAVFSREGELIPQRLSGRTGTDMRLIKYQSRNGALTEKAVTLDIVIPVRWAGKSVI